VEQAELKILAEKAAAIAKETADALKRFSKDTAILMYGSQLQQLDGNEQSLKRTTDEEANKKIEEANKKLVKTIEAAKIKWQYATEIEKAKVKEMERVIEEGKDRIKKLYEPIYSNV
jgi:Pyruvate/2-oxoacid:ferredoxin oxidoreductase gamma subunit